MESTPPPDAAALGTAVDSFEPRYREFEEDGGSSHLKPQRNATDGSNTTRIKITHLDLFGMGIVGTVCSLSYGTWQLQPAALLVIEFGFRAPEGRRRYKRAEISAIFEPLSAAITSTSSASAAATTYPVIRDFWPKNNANSTSSSNAADAAGHCPGSTQSIWPLQDFSIRGRHWMGQIAQAPNQVIWTIREIDRSEVGIYESIKLAVVVAYHGLFRATVKVSATTGIGLKVRSFPWSRDDPLLFDGRTPKGKQFRVSEFWGLEEKDLVQHMRESSSASSSDSTLVAAFDDRLVMGLPPARSPAKSTSAFRVRGIPSSLTLDSLVQSLVETLEVEAEAICIRCFTTNPYRAEKMAIVSFATLPSRLKEPQPTREWQTPLRLPTSESSAANLLFDTHFLGFSELGPGFEGAIDVE